MDIELRDRRYEIKMECEDILLDPVRSWVLLHPAAFREAFPPRWVNSLYFDTFGLDTLNDHIESVAERRKLRFRWYGGDLGLARGQLELKCKRERIGWKLVLPVGRDLDLHSQEWFDLQGEISSAIQFAPDRLFYELLQVSGPLIINRYRREYFVSCDDRIRLTLDYEISAFDQRLSPRPNLEFRLPMINAMVVEFKCAVEHYAYLADVLAQFPLRVRRYSKYVTAMDSMLER